ILIVCACVVVPAIARLAAAATMAALNAVFIISPLLSVSICTASERRVPAPLRSHSNHAGLFRFDLRFAYDDAPFVDRGRDELAELLGCAADGRETHFDERAARVRVFQDGIDIGVQSAYDLPRRTCRCEDPLPCAEL